MNRLEITRSSQSAKSVCFIQMPKHWLTVYLMPGSLVRPGYPDWMFGYLTVWDDEGREIERQRSLPEQACRTAVSRVLRNVEIK